MVEINISNGGTIMSDLPEKQFSLKDIDIRMVAALNQQAQDAMLNFLTYVAVEKMGYNATENSSYRVEDGKLYISELPPKESPNPVETA